MSTTYRALADAAVCGEAVQRILHAMVSDDDASVEVADYVFSVMCKLLRAESEPGSERAVKMDAYGFGQIDKSEKH